MYGSFVLKSQLTLYYGGIMFLVQGTRPERSDKIRSLMDIDINVAVIIAAADFEWTCRRCILALGKSPTKYIREELLAGATFSKYPGIWDKEVYPMVGEHINEVLTTFRFDRTTNDAFKLRNKLVHGESGPVSFNYGREKAEEILLASEELSNFAMKKHEPIYGRMIRRTKTKKAIYT